MKQAVRRSLLVVGIASFATLSSPVRAAESDFGGRWHVTVTYAGTAIPVRLDWDRRERTMAGDRLTLQGSTQHRAVKICLTDTPAKEPCADIPVRVRDSQLTGNGELLGASVAIAGERPAQRSSVQPKTHVYEPNTFQPRYASNVAPALRIFPGDSVRTKTIDSEGVDELGVRRSMDINPQTGPFYVEGAMPGDTLVVRLKSVALNRDSAEMFSSSVVAHALNADHVRSAGPARRVDSEWKLDVDSGKAQLTNPTEKLKNFSVELQPMLGCIGVAPPRGEAIVAFDLGVFGGNLDYPPVGTGASVYLPVFTPGAMLFIGDAHARQGAAELTGTGLETSAAVEFTVEVIEGASLGQVRVENADHVMIMGVGGSLGEGLQSATTGMSRWLTQTYGLNDAEIAFVLGSSMEYDIAEIVDPHVNVVAKLRKRVLEQIPVR